MGQFTVKDSLKSASITAFALVALALAGAGQAQAEPPQLEASKYLSGGIIVFAPSGGEAAIDSGFVYWVATKRIGTKSSPVLKSTLMQRSITTGLNRELFSTTRGFINQLGVGAGRIAFMHATVTNLKHPTKWTASLLAMSSADASPTVLASATTHFRYSKLTYKRNGKKHARKIQTSCGTSIDLRSVSETGQILSSETSSPCDSKREFSAKQSIYGPDSTTAVSAGLSDYESANSLSNNLLIYSGEKSAFAKDLVTGTQHAIRYDGIMLRSVTSSDGHIAVISLNFGRTRKISGTLNVYAPGAESPTTKTSIDVDLGSDIQYCNDTLLQVVAREKKPTRLVLRDLSGNVITQTDGPSSANYAGVTCNGRHVVVASLTKNGPVLSEYDL